MARPAVLVAIVGTATEVGKTWVACELVRRARSDGRSVAARKPAQSFEPASLQAAATDAHLLAAATGERPASVCPPARWYERAYAPPMAAEALGRPGFALDDAVDGLDWPEPSCDLGLVEAAGGLRSPIADDGDGLELVRRLRPDLAVLVADAGLGAIGAVRAAMDALATVATATVVLNRFDAGDDLHRRNAEWLARRDGYEVATSVAQLWSAVHGVRTAGVAGDPSG